MHLFYTPDIQQKQYVLNEEESKHAVRVLRLEQGAEVQLVDGRGGWYKAQVLDPNPKRCALQVIQHTEAYGQRNFSIHVAVAPTKNIERMEWFLEKATELGIDEITPIICQRSERKEVKVERLDKIIVAAMKQSMKAYKPVLNECINLSTFLQRPVNGHAFIAHCMDSADKQHVRTHIAGGVQRYTVLIGPEGDFMEDEVKLALTKGYKAITLGDSRLRTETAALAAVFELNFLNR